MARSEVNHECAPTVAPTNDTHSGLNFSPHVLNAKKNRTEYVMGRACLDSHPVQLTIVMGNSCNINCLHCYQYKNGDNLLSDNEIGQSLRTEFLQFYPFLETIRIQGGEVFAMKGFSELVDDIEHIIDRPLISVSTNGTLLNEKWAKKIVEIPFQTITFSFDAGTKNTFEKLRRGANFDHVVKNIKYLNAQKNRYNSWYPNLDAFFVVMRSNFREIPLFFSLLLSLEIYEVTFQTLLVDNRNLTREPSLLDEQLTSPDDIRELHDVLRQGVYAFRDQFDSIIFCGFKSLFESIGLSTDFLEEEKHSLQPVQQKVRRQRGEIKPPVSQFISPPVFADDQFQRLIENGQCANPWTSLFITENGDVSLCFLSEPIGNLYQTPLVEIWNSHEAVIKRSKILAGNYTHSGCSQLWCGWRDGFKRDSTSIEDWSHLLDSFKNICRLLKNTSLATTQESSGKLPTIRRIINEKDHRIKQLEANLAKLWDDNAEIHEKGQAYINVLESRISELNQQTSLSISGHHKQLTGHKTSISAKGMMLRSSESFGFLLKRHLNLFKMSEYLTSLTGKHKDGAINRPVENASASPIVQFESSASRYCLSHSESLAENQRVFCCKPFEQLEVHEGGRAYFCCPSWLPISIGTIDANNPLESWNSQTAKDIRCTILDGSFKYCNRSLCPYFHSTSGPVGTITQLKGRNVDPSVIQIIENNQTKLNHGPGTLNCCYDRSCNLSCASCRNAPIMHIGEERTKVLTVQNSLRKHILKDVRSLLISGSGDPIGSPSFRNWLRTMSGEESQSLSNIHLHTNGQLLDEQMWRSFSPHANEKLNSMEISIDAASEDTYRANRSPGTWSKLLNNLKFISGLKSAGEIKYVRISMVVQNNNYNEMSSFVELCRKFNFDHAFFSRIVNWFPSDESQTDIFLSKAVHLPNHPNFHDFRQNLHQLMRHADDTVEIGNLAEFVTLNPSE